MPGRSSAAGAQHGKTGENMALELQQQKPVEYMLLSGNTYPAQHVHSAAKQRPPVPCHGKPVLHPC